MRRTISALVLMSTLLVLPVLSLTSHALSAERIWTPEEIQSGEPGVCIIRSAWESRFTGIYEGMNNAATARSRYFPSVALLDVDALVRDVMDVISELYFTIENESQCPAYWPIQDPGGYTS